MSNARATRVHSGGVSPLYKRRPPRVGDWFFGKTGMLVGRVIVIQNIDGPGEDGDTPVRVMVMRDGDAVKGRTYRGKSAYMIVRSLYLNYEFYYTGTIDTAARLLECGTTFVHALIDSNQITSFEYEGETFVPLAEVETKWAEVRPPDPPPTAEDDSPPNEQYDDLVQAVLNVVSAPEFIGRLADEITKRIFERKFPELVERMVLQTLEEFTSPGVNGKSAL